MQLPAEEMLWRGVCDRWDKNNRFATWFDDCKLKSVRFNPATTEFGLYKWHMGHGRWLLEHPIEVNIFDPNHVAAIARKELEHDSGSKHSENAV